MFSNRAFKARWTSPFNNQLFCLLTHLEKLITKLYLLKPQKGSSVSEFFKGCFLKHLSKEEKNLQKSLKY